MNQTISWLNRKRQSILIVLSALGAIALLHYGIVERPVTGDATGSASLADSTQPAITPFSPVPLVVKLDEVISATRPVLSDDIEALTGNGDFQRAKNRLLDRALEAVASADNQALAGHLSELGELALLQGELGMAEVYLVEALELFDEQNDELQVAGVYIQMGRLHLYARRRARQAGNAYDQLLISRWRISQGLFYEAEESLKQVVQTNIELRRYGAAASAYETLYKGYNSVFDVLNAQNSGAEAMRLHAASGNLATAKRLLASLTQDGITPAMTETLTLQMNQHYREYEASVKAIGAARDYAQLYSQLSARGDALQAWRFRRQAEASLANASERARYRRQPDVLVELYRSNTSMEHALVSLKKASEVYARRGVSAGLEKSQQLSEQIY